MKSLNRPLLVLLLLVASPAGRSVELVQGEPGDVLLLPFFTTQAGWDTYLNLSTPESPASGAYRLRFIDGSSGEVTNSFNAYPLRNHVWSMSLTQRGSGSELRLADGNCVVDKSLNTYVSGESVQLAPQVGMIEIYRLGNYREKHIPHRATDDQRCQAISALWDAGGAWEEDPQDGIYAAPPSRDSFPRLLGEVYLVNVEGGAAVTYDALSLIDVLGKTPHTPPWSDLPNLADADPVALINGEEIEPLSGEGIDAVALALAQGKSGLANDIIVAPSINASTDWVLSYPLAPYRSYRPFTTSTEKGFATCDIFGVREPNPAAPTVEVPYDHNAVLAYGQGDNNGPLDITPVPPPVPEELALCRPVNVVSFGGAPPMLVDQDSDYVAPQPRPFPVTLGESPVMVLWRPYPAVFPEGSGIGRPVFGLRLTRFENGVLDGGTVQRNYAVLREHRRH